MPDDTSGLVAVHATREYYASKIAQFETRIEGLEIERDFAYAAGRIDAADMVRRMYMLGNATCAELTSAAQGGYTLMQTLPLDPMLGDGAMLQAASQALQEFVESEPGDERFTCLDGTHEPACTCGASDPDDARDAARERSWDGSHE